MIQWQHGSYTRHANGSIHLIPFAIDGRQLMSDHCASDNAMYSRYNTTEYMKVCTPHSITTRRFVKGNSC